MQIIIGLIEHIGDIVACEPVSRYVRDRYPTAHISWAVLGRYRELVDTNPHIDQTVVLGCLTDWIKISSHSEYDEIVDLHVNYRVCEECRVPLVKTHGNPFVNAYEWLDYGALLEAFSQGAGLPKLSAQPKLYLQPEHANLVDALQLPRAYCVVHRESNDINKDWPAERWRSLAQWITTELQLPIVEVGTSKSFGNSPLSDFAIDLLNRTPIMQTGEIIRRARFFVGIDSGPAHLANATRTPGVVLLGRYNMFRLYSPFTGFYASNLAEVKVLRNETGPAAEISVADVIESVRYITGILDGRSTVRDESPAQDPDLTGVGIEQDRDLIIESGLFDASWYRVHYPEALVSGCEAIDHFIFRGGQLGMSPGPDFNAAHYLKAHPDVARAGVNPLVHYLNFGRCEGRETVAVTTDRNVPEILPLDSDRAAADVWSNYAEAPIPERSMLPEELPRAFAFYLPQFHPIAQNNFGHRMGFTEWDNVIKAKPLFKGHYQPRVPGELGYYDLRAIDVMREQVSLASDHGLAGFCFYYYYFHGQRLLYKPIQNYINSDIAFPFFFMWANENWSRRWDGGNREVIISQQHSPEDDLAFIRDLVDVFADERYLKIDGKPVLMVYKTGLFPNILATTELWRRETARHGFPDLYLIMVDDWAPDLPHPRVFGFDATYEIPSNIVPQNVHSDETDRLEFYESFDGRIVDYHKFAQFHMSRPFPEYRRFRTVMLPWDNTPRYGSRAMVHINTGGDAYATWLTQALLDTRERYPPQERIVLIHSWNEWCEGTYLEPDSRIGRHFLEETRRAIGDARALVALDEESVAGGAFALMRRLARQKDIGAFRVMQSMRMQSYHAHRELDLVRARVATLEPVQSELERLLHTSRSRRRPMTWKQK